MFSLGLCSEYGLGCHPSVSDATLIKHKLCIPLRDCVNLHVFAEFANLERVELCICILSALKA